MDFGLKTPSQTRPESGWTDKQVTYARGILLNTPDVDRRTHYLRRVRQILVFIVFMAISLVAVSFHWAMIFLVWFIGMFVIGTEYFHGYGPSQRDLAWARSVLQETGLPLGEAPYNAVDRDNLRQMGSPGEARKCK